jgi:hypothetical protein
VRIHTNRSAYTKSSIITTVLVVIFVAIVIYGLVLTYLPTKQDNTSTTETLYTSGLTLISGSASSISFNQTCLGDTYLQLYVTNNSPNIYYLTNVTITAFHSSAKNSTVLVPISNGCLPVYESRPEIPEGSDDILIQTYPAVSVPPYTGWNVTIEFSDGQNITQPNLQAEPE